MYVAVNILPEGARELGKQLKVYTGRCRCIQLLFPQRLLLLSNSGIGVFQHARTQKQQRRQTLIE